MYSYLIIIAISILLVYCSMKIEEKTNNKFIIYTCRVIAILFPAIIAGIRYNTGTDYAGVYNPLFKEILSGNLKDRARKFEIGYILLNKIVILFGGNFNVVMFLSSLITISCIYFGLQHYKEKINIPLAFFFFMIISYQKTFNLVRQMMSIAIIFYGFKFLDIKDDENMIENQKYKNKFEKKCKEKNKDILEYKPKYKHGKEYLKYVGKEYFKYFICVIIASLFQRTSLIMLIVPFVREIYTNPKYKYLKIASYIILLVLILNFQTIGSIMAKSEKLKYYSYYFIKRKGTGISVAYFIRIIPAILPYFFLRKELNKDKQLSLLFGMNIIGSILLLLGYLTNTYGERLALFFTIFQIVLLPYYIRKFKSNKILFITSLIGLVSINMAIWYYDYIHKNRDETVPYKTVFSENNK